MIHRVTVNTETHINRTLIKLINKVYKLISLISIRQNIVVLMPINIFHRKFHNISIIEDYSLRRFCNTGIKYIYNEIFKGYRRLWDINYRFPAFLDDLKDELNIYNGTDIFKTMKECDYIVHKLSSKLNWLYHMNDIFYCKYDPDLDLKSKTKRFVKCIK